MREFLANIPVHIKLSIVFLWLTGCSIQTTYSEPAVPYSTTASMHSYVRNEIRNDTVDAIRIPEDVIKIGISILYNRDRYYIGEFDLNSMQLDPNECSSRQGGYANIRVINCGNGIYFGIGLDSGDFYLIPPEGVRYEFEVELMT